MGDRQGADRFFLIHIFKMYTIEIMINYIQKRGENST